MTVSIGVSSFPAPHVESAEDLFARAAAALRIRAKEQGRNRVLYLRAMTHLLLTLSCATLLACTGGDADSATHPPVEHRLTVPKGMVATVFATAPGARMLVLGPDGAVYVSQPAAGQIARLADPTGTGVASSQSIVVRGLNRPHGMAFHNGYFYVANTDGVVRMKLDANGRMIGKPEQLNHYPSNGSGHWTRTIVFGADGMMYVSIGSSVQLVRRTTVIQHNDARHAV